MQTYASNVSLCVFAHLRFSHILHLSHPSINTSMHHQKNVNARAQKYRWVSL